MSRAKGCMLPVVVCATESCSGGPEGYEEEHDGPLRFLPPQSLADSLEIGLPSLLLRRGGEYSNPISSESSESTLSSLPANSTNLAPLAFRNSSVVGLNLLSAGRGDGGRNLSSL